MIGSIPTPARRGGKRVAGDKPRYPAAPGFPQSGTGGPPMAARGRQRLRPFGRGPARPGRRLRTNGPAAARPAPEGRRDRTRTPMASGKRGSAPNRIEAFFDGSCETDLFTPAFPQSGAGGRQWRPGEGREAAAVRLRPCPFQDAPADLRTEGPAAARPAPGRHGRPEGIMIALQWQISEIKAPHDKS